MTDTWTIFGDPSLMVRTAAPVTMTVTHVNDLPVGSSQLMVYCNEEGARVAISDDYQLLGTGIVSGGSVNVNFGQINTQDTLTVTVTAFNCLPSIDSVIIANSSMASLVKRDVLCKIIDMPQVYKIKKAVKAPMVLAVLLSIPVFVDVIASGFATTMLVMAVILMVLFYLFTLNNLIKRVIVDVSGEHVEDHQEAMKVILMKQ